MTTVKKPSIVFVTRLHSMECPNCQDSNHLMVRVKRWIHLGTTSQTITIKALDHEGYDLCECTACNWAGTCWDAFNAEWQRELREKANTSCK